ncbi:MAG: CAP domain-containing protein [Pseudomonadota bacterium]
MFARKTLTGLAGFTTLCAASTGFAGSDRPDTSDERAWLAQHNAARAGFGSAPVRWNSDLENEARQWAQRLARSNQFRHSDYRKRNGTGENLWMGTRGHYAPAQMIASFGDERRHFVPGRFPGVSRTGNWADVGHYTQIVWPETREVGCAKASGAQNDVLVCRYWPSGNVMGQAIAPMRKVARRR